MMMNFMSDTLEDMIRDIEEPSYMKSHIYDTLYRRKKVCLYIRGAPVLHDCLRC